MNEDKVVMKYKAQGIKKAEVGALKKKKKKKNGGLEKVKMVMTFA